jgi:hypothetical protein
VILRPDVPTHEVSQNMLTQDLAKLSRPPRIGRCLRVVTALSAALLPSLASAAPWGNSIPLEDAGHVSQKVELVDINGDGFVDLVFANSSGDETGNQADAQQNQVFINDGIGNFTADPMVFPTPDNAYVIKAGDVDRDGDPDLVVGVNFAGQSYVLLNDGGSFTQQMLGDALNRSIGDLELGDVDGDGDLDVFAADWGMSQPYGDPDDLGGPLRLWLGDGDGGFGGADANLPMGMESLASWVFDVELVDFDNDYDLDALISSRGFGKALVFRNDGAGNFENYAVPALQPGVGKNVNVAFTPIDVDGDDFVDVLTLQDGPGGGACVIIDGDQYCAKRNSLLINDTLGQFLDNPGDFWDVAFNQPKLDFDAATLDFNNDGFPDFIATGFRLGGADNNNRLFINDPGMKKYVPAVAPNDAAFPIDVGLSKTFGLAFADFNGDRREDVAVAVRNAEAPNVVLFGGDQPDAEVPMDVSAPNISNHEMLANLLYFGQAVTFRGRAHDYKTPTQWHDFQYEPNLDALNLIGDVPTEHKRRLPYIEFMFGLNDPNDIKNVPDTDPGKYISPGVWEGEALWQVDFDVPLSDTIPDTLTWQFCAIDAAGNKACDGPYQVMVDINCGNGQVDLGEECDDPNDVLCVDCVNTCGDGVCEDPETPENCPEDCPICDNDGVCEPPENEQNCPNDCPPLCNNNNICEPPENPDNCPNDCPMDSESDTDGCGNGICEPPETPVSCPEDCPICDNDGVCESPENNENCPNDCPDDVPTTGFTTADDTTSTTEPGQLDDDGCGCVSDSGGTRGLWGSLLLLCVFGVRRSRRR